MLADDRADDMQRIDAIGGGGGPDLLAQPGIVLQQRVNLAVFRLIGRFAGLGALGRTAWNCGLLDEMVADKII